MTDEKPLILPEDAQAVARMIGQALRGEYRSVDDRIAALNALGQDGR